MAFAGRSLPAYTGSRVQPQFYRGDLRVLAQELL